MHPLFHGEASDTEAERKALESSGHGSMIKNVSRSCIFQSPLLEFASLKVINCSNLPRPVFTSPLLCLLGIAYNAALKGPRENLDHFFCPDHVWHSEDENVFYR